MNSIPAVTTKLLTLLPVAVALYYFDLPGAYSVLSSPQPMAIVAASVMVVVFGLLVKRKIVKENLELSEASFVLGTIMLAAFVAFYVYAPYSAFYGILRYESLILLVVAYILYRIGARIVRALVPLLSILALAYPITVRVNETAVALFAGETLFIFLFYVRAKPRTLLVPAALIGLGVLAWFHPELAANVGGLAVLTWYLLPVPIALLAIPVARSFGSMPPPSLGPSCASHDVNVKGFCLVCGRRVASPRTPERFAPWGLVTIIGVAVLLLLGSVPVLALNNGVPANSLYASSGVSITPLPTTPSGWEVNSTVVFHYGAIEPYAVEKVYVPIYHPEVKNYTMYFEVAAVSPLSAAPSGGEIPGWGRIWNNFTNFGPFHGYLTAYQNPSGTMLSYSGVTAMTFLGGGVFQNYYVGLSFVREFKNFTPSNDSAQFMSDINLLWLPAFSNSVYYSTWTAFLSTTDFGAAYTVPFVEVVTTTLMIGWLVYRARLSDHRLDDFVRKVSRLAEGPWLAVVGLLDRPRKTGPGYEMLSGAKGGPILIKELERHKLIEEKLVENGNELALVWKAAT